MTTFLLTCVVASIAVGAYVQIRFAYANYPSSKEWLSLRICTSFVVGFFIGLLLFHWDYHGIRLVAFSLIVGLVTGVLITVAFPINMQHVIPKRNEMDEK